MNETDVAIVGAGISGLLAAKHLQSQGHRVVVFDKARGVGGRMATRRADDSVFDHGAQYFTARDPEFRGLVEDWCAHGLVKQWSEGFALAGGGFKHDNEPRWFGVHGMSTVAKHLAARLDVRLHSRIAGVRPGEAGWALQFEDGPVVNASALLLTPPVPQSLALLEAGGVVLPSPTFQQLRSIEYAPCIALLVKLAGPSQIPPPGGLWASGEPIAWISDNSQKGIAPTGDASITLHAGPQFSRDHWNSGDAVITDSLLRAALNWLGDRVISTQLHRWRYSVPRKVFPGRCLAIEAPAPLVFAGDAFGGPRVEGAALSGLAAGRALIEQLAGKLEQSHAV